MTQLYVLIMTHWYAYTMYILVVCHCESTSVFHQSMIVNAYQCVIVSAY